MENTSYHGSGKLSSKLYSDLAVDIIKKEKTSGNPFFLLVSFTLIHSPLQDVNITNSKPASMTPEIRNGMIAALDEAVGDIVKVAITTF